MKTKIAIIGGGVSGLMLGNLCYSAGIDCIILERQTREYTEKRIRAGVLEYGAVELLRKMGVSANMDAHGLRHEGFTILDEGVPFRLNLHQLVGQDVLVYGQTEITIDLMDACAERNIPLVFEAQNVALHDITSQNPKVTYEKDGKTETIECDFIAGCDGFHGVSRHNIPDWQKYGVEKVYPFGWLGIMADVAPMDEELVYSNHARGFALASMRSKTRSRYYIQCPLSEKIEDWSDERIWDELEIRLEGKGKITRGPSIEKSIAPLRSFVCEKLNHGRLFLCGDAGHIVPPAGAKGLNLAASDISYLFDGLVTYCKSGDESGLLAYEKRALARIWKAERFSWAMTMLTHRFENDTTFERKMQKTELEYLRTSVAAQTAIAENYVGLPY